jgi:hypothetical protein
VLNRSTPAVRCSSDPVSSVHILSIFIDSDLVMRMHVKRKVLRCFAELRQLRQIRRSLLTTTFQLLVVVLVHSQLDYGYSALFGIPI